MKMPTFRWPRQQQVRHRANRNTAPNPVCPLAARLSRLSARRLGSRQVWLANDHPIDAYATSHDPLLRPLLRLVRIFLQQPLQQQPAQTLGGITCRHSVSKMRRRAGSGCIRYNTATWPTIHTSSLRSEEHTSELQSHSFISY